MQIYMSKSREVLQNFINELHYSHILMPKVRFFIINEPKDCFLHDQLFIFTLSIV